MFLLGGVEKKRILDIMKRKLIPEKINFKLDDNIQNILDKVKYKT